MKWIVYSFKSTMQIWNENEGIVDKEIVVDAKKEYSEENLEYVKTVALDGKYTIEDDGVEEVTPPTQEEQIKELQEALELLLSGVTE